jgi:hypothetical protein
MADSDNRALALDPEVLEDQAVAFAPSTTEALVRGELDVQITTAKRYPRSLELFQQRAIAMATLDEDTAESCMYRRPVGKKKNRQTGRLEPEYAEGMSIRMAEIVGACYGNLRVYASLIEQPDQFVRARGMAIDLETNFASSSEVIESTLKNKTDRDGNIIGQEPMSPRMRIVIAKAALSKARRDATFQVVPKALAKPIEQAARAVLLGTTETLDKRRQKVAAWISKLGIDERRVYAAIGIEGPADLTAERLEDLTGLRTAIKDNETTIDEAFPALEGDAPRQGLEELLRALEPTVGDELRAQFKRKGHTAGQALALLRKYEGRIAELGALLDAMPDVESQAPAREASARPSAAAIPRPPQPPAKKSKFSI